MRERARGEARTRTSRCTVRIRFPSRMTVCRSWPRVNRWRRGNPKPSLSAGVLVRKLHSEALPPLLATTAEYFASPLRFHARAESVRLDPALVTRTIGGLTHGRLQKTVKKS